MALPERPTGALRTGSIADELARGQINLHVVVVSPVRQIFEGDAHWVTATGVDGQFGIWPRHVAMVAALGGGPLRIGLPGGEVARFAVRGGFLDVSDNEITILVGSAETEAEVNSADAKRDLDDAVTALAHPRSDEEFAEFLDRRAWSQARLNLTKE